MLNAPVGGSHTCTHITFRIQQVPVLIGKIANEGGGWTDFDVTSLSSNTEKVFPESTPEKKGGPKDGKNVCHEPGSNG
jgi:hypothetical protein